MRRPIVAGLAVLGVLGVAVAEEVEVPPRGPDALPVVEQLSRIGASLERLEALLAEQVEIRSIDLLLKRSDLTSREIADLEDRLRSATTTRESRLEERGRLEEHFEVLLSDPERTPEEAERFTLQAEGELERIESAVKRLDREIAVLRGDVARKRQELEEWRFTLDRRLRERDP